MVYLDHHATTPVDARVLEAMLPFFTGKFGNAASKQHRFGWDANDAVERARKQVAALIGAGSKDIVFTSGATEANNLAIRGVAEAYAEKGRHFVSQVTEHKAVVDPLKRLARDGVAGRSRRARRRGDGSGGDHGAHGARERDGREQRDRRPAADQRIGRGGPRKGRVVSHRRGAGGGQSAV